MRSDVRIGLRDENQLRFWYQTESREFFWTSLRPVLNPKNVWNLNMVSLCHGMKEIKSIQYFFYKKSRQHKQTAHLSTLFEKNMLPRCGCAITGTISSLKLPGPLVIESGELKTHPSWLDPYVNTGYIHRLDHRCTSYTMLEVKLISGGGDNLWIQACTPNKA